MSPQSIASLPGSSASTAVGSVAGPSTLSKSSSPRGWKSCRTKQYSKKWFQCEEEDARGYLDRWMPSSNGNTKHKTHQAHAWPRNATVHDVMQMEILRDFFPTFELEVVQEVFYAAQFQLELAAEMLGNMVTETNDRRASTDLLLSDAEFVDLPEDGEDMLHPSHLDMQQWVVVQNEWEIVDVTPPNSPPMPSFAEIVKLQLQQQAKDQELMDDLLMLPAPASTFAATGSASDEESRAKPMQSAELRSIDDVEIVVKSFGERKRRSLVKHHRVRR